MKRSIVFVLLLLVLSPFASALAYTTNPFWEVDGQNVGTSLTIEDGESALAGSPAFASLDCDVTFVAELLNADMSLRSVLANTEVDTCQNVGFMYVPVDPSDYDVPGDYLVRFHLEDTRGSDTRMLQLHVIPATQPNVCPVLGSISSPRYLDVGVAHSFDAHATDSDGDALTYSAQGLPAGATLSANGHFAWTPGPSAVGQHVITVRVSDGECVDSQIVTLIVEQEPVCDLVMEPLETPLSVNEGETIAFQVLGYSADPVFYSAQGVPANAIWDDVAGVFVWITGNQDAGVYDVTFTASTSPSCSESQDVHITVIDGGLPACSDGQDNDGDGLVDYPADPGCTSAQDDDEYNAPLPACSDGLDNDGDGLVDMADPGCSGPSDNDEFNPSNVCPVAAFEWAPDHPDMGETINLVSTSADGNNDPLTYAWDVNNDGITDSTGSLATTVFNQAGSHPVTLTVSDGQCQDSVTNYIQVVPQCILEVESIDCLSPVIQGESQACTVHVDSGNSWPGGITVDVFYSNHEYAGYCLTDSLTGSCTAYFQAPAQPGTYSVYATAQRNGCVGDLNFAPADSFDVFADGYDIANLAIYNNPAFAQEDYDFLRAQDMFVRFQVLDPFNNPVNDAITSVELLSPPGGHAYFSEYQYSNPAPGYYDYFLQIPASHDFLGQSHVFVFQFNFNDGTGAQRVVGVNIHNNAPEIASEGVVVMGQAASLHGHAVTLNVVDPVAMTGTFMVSGETVGPLMEGYAAALGDGAVFHVHDIDFDNQPYSAVVSLTADDYLSDNVFTGQVLSAPASFDLEPFESDVEDYGEALDWSASGVDANIFAVSFDASQDVMTVTPVAPGCDTFTLELWDLDNAIDTMQVTLCSNPAGAPACSDGLDNDGDGLVDMNDPGCSNPSDNDEYNYLPQCADGVDNDGDGLVDLNDPGCSGLSDDDEHNLLPQCSDGIDNDNDELVDMQDPGCSSPQDNSEDDVVLPQCSDGLDNDGDGLVDLYDPGCVDAQDDDESNVAVPACSDGVDNDGDGLIDMNDPGCSSAQDNDESNAVTQCSDSVDNDGDGLVDLMDPGCLSPSDDDESNVVTPQCSDGIDNDGDGLVDYPADPGCSAAGDNDESNVAVPACSDGLDNDGDGMIDYAGAVLQSGSTSATISGPASSGTINLNNPECSDGIDNDGDGELDYPQDAACSGPNDNTEGSPNQCSDGADNDGDGLTDHPADPDCENGSDNSEGVPQNLDYEYYQYVLDLSGVLTTVKLKVHSIAGGVLIVQLEDGMTYQMSAGHMATITVGGVTQHVFVSSVSSNSADIVLYATQVVPADPGCDSAQDNDEWNMPLSECSDGVDNDGDGLVDMADPDCVDSNDDSEQGTVPACADGLDNDNDGHVDLADPGCSSASDNDEFNVWPACSDGLDNDGDGYVDMADPGCSGPSDNDEWHQPFQCEDGMDNDGDGLTDMVDPGCSSPFDDQEFTPPSQCNDELDNDHDGLVDMWDPDCSSEGDDTEYPSNPQCSDGIDNDGDGRVDLADPHCYDQYDEFEGEIDVPAPYRPWSDMDDLLITRIDVNGFDVEDFTVMPGEYIMVSVSVENTLDYDLEDLKVRVFLDDYGLWATKTLHELDAGDTVTVNMHVDVPVWIEPGVYDLRFTASNDDIRRVKYRHLVVV
ncbi:TPA: PKD domain-containing protein [Candidatus Woesearchaeota archaeon]|nr:PKD domain-containing protein [Candidatus Woesearchaeota archaeon]